MISTLAVRLFLWYGVRVLKFPCIVLKHDDMKDNLDGVSFCYSEKYADEIESLSLKNARKDFGEDE